MGCMVGLSHLKIKAALKREGGSVFVCDSGGERARAPHLRPVLGSLINLEGCNCFELYLMVCAAGLPGSGEKQQSHESYCWGQSRAQGERERERIQVCKKSVWHVPQASAINLQLLGAKPHHLRSSFLSLHPSADVF